MRKRAEFDFVMIFAIVAGVMILFLAIYGARNFGTTTQTAYDTEIAKKLAVIMDPMQAGFADARTSKFVFRQDIRINNYCYSDFERFGKNQFSIQTMGPDEKLSTVPGGENALPNKYVFSEQRTQGKEFFVLSQSFSLPYKVSDILVLTTKKYCFVDAPDDIKRDVEGISLKNVFFEDKTKLTESECLSEYTRVCFGSGTNCDVTIHGTCTSNCEMGPYSYGTIVKRDGEVRYVWPLLYAGIFSSVDNYECNIKRLLYRTSSIAKVYMDKIDLMSARNCNSNLGGDLSNWRVMTVNASQRDLIELKNLGVSLNKKNSQESCGVW